MQTESKRKKCKQTQRKNRINKFLLVSFMNFILVKAIIKCEFLFSSGPFVFIYSIGSAFGVQSFHNEIHISHTFRNDSFRFFFCVPFVINKIITVNRLYEINTRIGPTVVEYAKRAYFRMKCTVQNW